MSDSDSPLPFFIVGAPRSGTTLVSAILGSHSRLAVYIESNYYLFFRPHLHRYGDLGRHANLRRLVSDVRQVIGTQWRMDVPTEEEFLDALVAPTFEGVFATMLKLHARQDGKLRCGEKTPRHHAYLGEILEKFPGSPVIFLMRDPRDLVVSIRRAFGTSLKSAVWAWNEAFQSYQRASSSVHLVRYEELVANPDERSAVLCAALGESYEPEILRFFERMRHVSRPIPLQHRRILEPVDTKFVGRFRQLPRHEIEWIESACAAGMEALGYEFACGRPTARVTTPPGRVNLFLDQVRFYRFNRTRWWRALTRRKIALRVRAHSLLSSIRQRFA